MDKRQWCYWKKVHTLDMLKAKEITLTEKFREEKAKKIKTNMYWSFREASLRSEHAEA